MYIKIVSKVILCLSFLLFACVQVFSADNQSQKNAEFKVAQISINLGVTEDDIVKRLKRSGYSEIRIVKKGFTKLRVQACYEGARYVLSVRRLSGKIKRGSKIGECRQELNIDDIIAKLRSKGFKRIAVQDTRSGDINIIACERRRRFRIFVNRYGDILNQKEIGFCRFINAFEIRQRLKDDGFNRIKVVEKTFRGFILEACLDATRVRLRVNRRGRIRRQRRIGRCSLPINPNNIAGVIAKKGYDRINVLDKQLPVYQAEACKGLNRLQIKMNRFGDIIREQSTGECDPPLALKEVKELLRAQGGKKIKIKGRGRRGNLGFLATACLKFDRVEFIIDRYGSVLNRTVVDKCHPPRLNEVMDRLSKRGMSKMKIFVEACRRRRLVRFELDQFGDVINRERIGRCRR